MGRSKRRGDGRAARRAIAGAAAAIALAACGTATTPSAGQDRATTARGARAPGHHAVPGLPARRPSAAPRGFAAPGVACAPDSYVQGKPGTPVAITARLEGYSVELAGTVPPADEPPGFEHPVLNVTVPGGTRHRRALSFLRHDTLLTLPITAGKSSSEMCLVRFGRSVAPTVVFAEWFATAQPYTDVLGIPLGPEGIGSPLRDEPFVTGVSLVTRGQPLLLADDARFATYDGWAAHVDPPLVVTAAGGRFVDVTSSHPALVEPALDAFWHLWLRSGPQYYGATNLLAWTAAECSIGKGSAAEAELSELAARGQLDWTDDLQGPGGMPWVRGTESLLAGWGYCRGGATA